MTAFQKLFKISWRNIFRNKRRSLLTFAVLVIGSSGLILIGGFFDNILTGLREQFIHGQSGHIQVARRDYFAKGVTSPLDYLMRDVRALQTEVESLPHVQFTVPRLVFNAMASSDRTNVAVAVLGTDAERERRMGDYDAQNMDVPTVHILTGENLSADDPYGAILGKGLASALGLKVGDPVSVVTTRQAGAIDSASYRVRGIFETIMKDVDDRLMKVNLGTSQRLLGLSDEVHTLLVLLDETERTEGFRQLLAARLGISTRGLELRTWEEAGDYYRQSKAMLDRIFVVIQLIVCVVFLFSIANTLNMALHERIREFGTMMAIGNGRPTIFGIILLEAFFMGLLGAVLGLLIGAGAAHAVSAMGIEMPPPPMGSNPYRAMISLSEPLLARTFLTALGATVVSAVPAACRFCRFRVVEALGYV